MIENIETAYDCPSVHPELNNKVPMLDLAMWVEETLFSAQGQYLFFFANPIARKPDIHSHFAVSGQFRPTSHPKLASLWSVTFEVLQQRHH